MLSRIFWEKGNHAECKRFIELINDILKVLKGSRIMSRKCDICGKTPSIGHNVSHANNKTRKIWNPNLQRVRHTERGTVRHVTACTRCIRSGLVVKPA